MIKSTVLLFFSTLILSSYMAVQEKPTLYIIGDSTVRNTNGVQWGWGSLLGNFLDTNRLPIINQAMAGRSTRTFVKEGRWNKVLTTLKKGDFLFMQFGHNEGSKPDTTRGGYRGVLKGTGEDSVLLVWPDSTKEIVHSYGWYLRKFIKEAKAKGATPIVLSMIPRNQFRDGKVIRAENDYGKWAREVALETGAMFIDLNSITADKYDKLGPDEVKKFFPGDHTHTNREGALLNAASVAEGIRQHKEFILKKYLLHQ